jgi:aromatic-L-amino-acid decarboxylase
MPDKGAPIETLLARLGPAVTKSFTTPGPGYLAFIPGGGLPSSALGNYIAASVNRYVGVAKAAPVLAEIEATAVRWLSDSMGYPKSARGVLTTGGSLSNLAAIVTARTKHLGDDFGRGVIYASEETHASLAKAARIAGFRQNQIRLLPVDARFRLSPDVLREAIETDQRAGQVPFLLNVNLGTTNTGAVDPVPALAQVANEAGLWIHADAAYGGFFRWVDPALVPGLELADSVALDPHKGLFLPYGTGCLLVRDADALRGAHQSSADYLRDVAPDDGQDNFTDLSPELSRAFRGLGLWLPLMLHGAAAFRNALSEKLELARHAARALAADDAFELVEEPQLSVVAFRLRDRTDDDNARLLARVNARGRVFLSSTRLQGRLTLRICVLCFRTHRDRVDEAVAALRQEAARL